MQQQRNLIMSIVTISYSLIVGFPDGQQNNIELAARLPTTAQTLQIIGAITYIYHFGGHPKYPPKPLCVRRWQIRLTNQSTRPLLLNGLLRRRKRVQQLRLDQKVYQPRKEEPEKLPQPLLAKMTRNAKRPDISQCCI